jgi:hypothetical protein
MKLKHKSKEIEINETKFWLTFFAAQIYILLIIMLLCI